MNVSESKLHKSQRKVKTRRCVAVTMPRKPVQLELPIKSQREFYWWR